MFQSRDQILSLLASLAAGILLALMMQINASLGKIIGPLESSFVVHLVGTIFALLLILRHLNQDFARQIKKVPIKLYTCGFYGVVLVLIANVVVPHLGMVLSVAIVLTSSLVSSVLVDHIGLLQPQKHPMNPMRIMGLLCAIGGLILTLKG